MNSTTIYIITGITGAIVGAIGTLSALFFNLRSLSTRNESRLTKNETEINNINARLDRDRVDSQLFQQRLEERLDQNFKLLDELRNLLMRKQR
ncbi:MAG: hypothetical protein KGL39_38875 [Patescibacteria group bacterium]|nr:hypothetical protein [Patescibacteria group bacterium]